ncbi:hypothetical protein [Nocardia sp. NPDC059228]|uniref:hypothetical protein n=1 Tax=Nocardia sp. NPDC059228 TaxID=3346777 RepID=UPI0036BF7082
MTVFFGLDLAKVLPYNLTRTRHLQLALSWVVAAFPAAGIFLAPLIVKREQRGQGKLSYMLLGAVAVVFGSLIGETLSIHGKVSFTNFFAAQQFTFLDLARFWQILLVAGLAISLVILYSARGWPRQFLRAASTAPMARSGDTLGY